MLQENPCHHPIIILKDVQAQDIINLLSYMYHGEVNVDEDNLPSFIQTAELLQIKGLSTGVVLQVYSKRVHTLFFLNLILAVTHKRNVEKIKFYRYRKKILFSYQMYTPYVYIYTLIFVSILLGNSFCNTFFHSVLLYYIIDKNIVLFILSSKITDGMTAQTITLVNSEFADKVFKH